MEMNRISSPGQPRGTEHLRKKFLLVGCRDRALEMNHDCQSTNRTPWWQMKLSLVNPVVFKTGPSKTSAPLLLAVHHSISDNPNKSSGSLITQQSIRTSRKPSEQSINYLEHEIKHGRSPRNASATTHQGLQQRGQKKRLAGGSKLPRRAQHSDRQKSCSILSFSLSKSSTWIFIPTAHQRFSKNPFLLSWLALRRQIANLYSFCSRH